MFDRPYVQILLNDNPDECGVLHVHLWALDDLGRIWAFLCFEGETMAVVPAEDAL